MSYFEPESPTLLADPVTPRDHARGNAAGGITIVEYGDFACPACREAYATLKTLLAENPDVRWVFRANPRSHVFPNAIRAAEAAEGAAAQGAFWGMHDRLFESDAPLERDNLVEHARALGLDVDRFAQELDGGFHRAAVHAQEISGWHGHVLSTPTFFINGVRFDDAWEALPAALARVRKQAQRAQHLFREALVQSTAEPRAQLVVTGPHRFNADLPTEEGGADAAPGPYDLLLAALGACTAMTVQWSAQKHKLSLRRVAVRLSQARLPDGHVFRRSVLLDGDLSESERQILEHAADSCPVARTLKGALTIDTRVTIDRTVEEAGEESFPASDPPAWNAGRDPQP